MPWVAKMRRYTSSSEKRIAARRKFHSPARAVAITAGMSSTVTFSIELSTSPSIQPDFT